MEGVCFSDFQEENHPSMKNIFLVIENHASTKTHFIKSTKKLFRFLIPCTQFVRFVSWTLNKNIHAF